jgi:hypothetical protein
MFIKRRDVSIFLVASFLFEQDLIRTCKARPAAHRQDVDAGNSCGG